MLTYEQAGLYLAEQARLAAEGGIQAALDNISAHSATASPDITVSSAVGAFGAVICCGAAYGAAALVGHSFFGGDEMAYNVGISDGQADYVEAAQRLVADATMALLSYAAPRAVLLVNEFVDQGRLSALTITPILSIVAESVRRQLSEMEGHLPALIPLTPEQLKSYGHQRVRELGQSTKDELIAAAGAVAWARSQLTLGDTMGA